MVQGPVGHNYGGDKSGGNEYGGYKDGGNVDGCHKTGVMRKVAM